MQASNRRRSWPTTRAHDRSDQPLDPGEGPAPSPRGKPRFRKPVLVLLSLRQRMKRRAFDPCLVREGQPTAPALTDDRMVAEVGSVR